MPARLFFSKKGPPSIPRPHPQLPLGQFDKFHVKLISIYCKKPLSELLTDFPYQTLVDMDIIVFMKPLR